MASRRHLKILALATFLVPVAVTGCSGETSLESSSLQFDVVPTERQVIDTGATGASMGDSLSSNGDLKSDNGEVIGHYSMHGFTTQVMPGREERFLNIEYEFSTGDAIEAQGSNDYPLTMSSGQPTVDGHADDNLILGIIGGTGKYNTARGSCQLTYEAPNYHASCTVKQ
ncbi:MAG: hypothetical protein F2520_05635 [Actinobacteria bacterium]|uniref:Unannotated protein n=1 Tax=freshwater metagenome TaxID=449393 RepID=A0A6J7IZ41_9ZZZZ|nr:hypothetical protein [Actinomycetota bacterium]MTA77722.1 hypothetical protein [Actinomycetota bacterium]